MFAKFKNQNFLNNRYFFLFIFFSILLIHQFIFQQFFPNPEGFLGHDYEQFIPNLMFGKIWFYKNFFSIPWFTPSFCCGIPFYADPNTLYYSIPQIIFLIFNPDFSIKLIFFIFSFVAYIGMFLLIKKNFKFNTYVALLCASLFLFNGFFVYRAIAGPLLTYVFVPLYCFLLICSYEEKLKKSLSYVYLIFSSLLFANFIHSGSGSVILLILASILSILLFYSKFVESFKIFINFFLSLFFGMLISLSKITAVLFFLGNFPRQYPATEFNSFFSFTKNIFLSFFLNPNEKYFNENVTSMFPFGVHEMEYGVSIVPIIIVLLLLFFFKKRKIKLNYNNIVFLSLSFLFFLIPFFLNINFFNQYEIISKIPILKSNWVRFRWIAIYILPIIIISGIIIQSLNLSVVKKNYLSITLIFVLLTQNILKDKTWHLKDQSYNIKNAVDFSLKLKNGVSPEIIGPAILIDKFNSIKKVDYKNDMFFYSWSPLTCYQPIFGYGFK